MKIIGHTPSQGRDPDDTATMELPGIEPPVPDTIVARICAGLYEQADDACVWLLLLLGEMALDYDDPRSA